VTSLVGEFFLNLIEQDRIWKTREGRVLLVEELEPRHRANVLTMLGRRAPGLYREWIREFLDEGDLCAARRCRRRDRRPRRLSAN
jgi:hypothetical protein